MRRATVRMLCIGLHSTQFDVNVELEKNKKVVDVSERWKSDGLMNSTTATGAFHAGTEAVTTVRGDRPSQARN